MFPLFPRVLSTEPTRRTVGMQMKPMSYTARALFALALAAPTIPANAAVHIWEKQELTLTSARSFPNPYTDVTVWVDLTGPNFKKRVYGFWDGEQTFRVRVLATAPGTWTWRSGFESAGPGTRRARAALSLPSTGPRPRNYRTPYAAASCAPPPTITPSSRPTARPFFVIGDTWYATGTNRFRWYDDDQRAPHRAERRFQRLRALPQSRRATTGSTSSRRFPTG